MKRPGFTFRPNLKKQEHRRAWETLQSVPEGEKGDFLVRAILASEQNSDWENTLRRVIREELKTVSFQTVPQQEEQIPKEMMSFLSSLTGEE